MSFASKIIGKAQKLAKIGHVEIWSSERRERKWLFDPQNSIFGVKIWCSLRWPNFNMSYLCEFLSFSNGFWCKRHLRFTKKYLGNIWSTFGQQMLPKCCPKEGFKNSFLCIFWHKKAFKATFRQQMLPKCWPNVDFQIFHKT